MHQTFGVSSRAGRSTNPDAGDVLGNSTNAKLGKVYMPAQHEAARRTALAIQRPEAGRTTG